MRSNNFLHAVIFLVSGGIVFAQDATDQKPVKEILAGHSSHGEAFNEGPRQAAYLMPGTGTVRFPPTTTNPEAEKFVEQGVGQLHGFWFFVLILPSFHFLSIQKVLCIHFEHFELKQFF